ncbi:MAG: hypothetical protein KDD38_02170 [Bdellovibrionales bacterium]|nr:hypothetical protein [Bdellovibrionales bacterium]
MHNHTPVIKKILILISLTIPIAFMAIHKTDFRADKSTSLKPHNEILIRTTKLLPHFSVRLSKTESDSENNRFALTAQIETEKNIPQLNYKWILPLGVQLLGGAPVEGVITNVTARGGRAWTAQLASTSEENQKIHLRVWVEDGANTLVTSAQYNTLLQNEIDFEKSELVKRQNEYLLDHPELLKKYK